MINLYKTNTSVVINRPEESVYLSLYNFCTSCTCLLTILIFFNLVSVCQGQDKFIYKAKQISPDEGLTSPKLNSIIQDHIGYIWMGTEHGLNRYDGNEIIKYHKINSDSTSLKGNRVFFIYEDLALNLWVSTSNGLCLYNRLYDNFKHTSVGTDKTGWIFNVFEDQDEIWFPRFKWEFDLYNKRNNSFRTFKVIPKFQDPPEYFTIDEIKRFDDENILLAIQRYGLFRLNKETGEVHEFCRFDIPFIRGLEVIGDRIYCASQKNIFIISKKTGVILQKYEKDFCDEIFDFEFIKKDSTFWAGTNAGIFIFDTSLNRIKRLRKGPSVKDVLPSSVIRRITPGSNDQILLGSHLSGGIILYPYDFELFGYSDSVQYSPSRVIMNTIYEDNEGQIWIGMKGGKMDLFNSDLSEFEHFQAPGESVIRGITDFSKDTLLICQYRTGFSFFNKKTRTFSKTDNYPFFKQIAKNSTYDVFKDSKNNLWITDYQKIYKYNLLTSSWRTFEKSIFKSATNDLELNFLTAYEDKSEKIWFGTKNGVFAYSYKTDNIEDTINVYEFEKEYSGVVNAITTDELGNILMGTNAGLYKYDIHTNEVSSYVENPNYRSLRYLILYKDENQNIWSGTNSGLLKIKKTDSTEIISKFKIIDSNRDLEFLYDAKIKSGDGNLYMGAIQGLLRFNPAKIEPQEVFPKVVIVSFKRHYSKNQTEIDSTIALNIKNSQTVVLPYVQSSYDFSFNAFDYINSTTEYKYTLENFESNWHTTYNNLVTYTNLAPGKYTFRVEAKNNHGLWGGQTTDIHLTILPPWWKTNVFRILLIFTFVAIFIGLFRWRENRIRKQNKKLESLVKERTFELTKSNEQLKLSREEAIEDRKRAESANKAKSLFLANMNHELRTPLNAILGFSRLLVKDTEFPEQRKEDIKVINNSGEHLLNLINDILDLAKIESGRLMLIKKTVNLKSIVQDVTDLLKRKIYEKNLHITLDISPDFPVYVEADPVKMRQIFINLIGNAIKFTNKGSIEVRLWHKPDTNHQIEIHAEVEDTGIGIAPENRNKIFKPFEQIGVVTETKGTGLGLTITKDFIELMGGTISFESKPGIGTKFFFKIPANISHQPDETSENKKGKREFTGFSTDVKNYKILVAEDHRNSRLYLKRLLQSAGFTVQTAVNGKEAVEFYEKEKFHLILMDRRMPEMDGLKATQIIKDKDTKGEVNIIIMSASLFLEQRMDILTTGAVDFIEKPVKEEEVIDKIAKHLGLEINYTIQKECDDYNVKEIKHLSSDLLSKLAPDLLKKLREYSVSGQKNNVLSAIKQIEDQCPDQAKELILLANSYNFEHLVNLIDEVL